MTTTAEAPRMVDGVELFDPPPAHTRFAPGDVLRLVVGALAFVVAIIVGSYATATVDGIETDIVDGIAELPDPVEQVLIGTAQLFATAVPLIALAVVLLKRRWRILGHVWLASILSALALESTIRFIDDRDATASIRARAELADTTLVAADFPTTAYLASAIAAATVAAAYVPRRWRRAIWGWIWVLVVLRFLGPGQPPLDILVAASIGSLVGALLLIAIGSPSIEPTGDDLVDGLRSTHLDPVRIDRLGASNGSVRYRVVCRSGDDVFVKLRTPDDHDWDLLHRTYRAIRLRSSEVSRPFSTLKRRVEHEALAPVSYTHLRAHET